MSGFLDRMAARAGGAAAEVVPRVPALFESAGVDTAPIGAAALETGPVPFRLPPSVPPALPTSLVSRPEPVAASPRPSAVEAGYPPAAAWMASAQSRPAALAAELQPVALHEEPAGLRAEHELVPEPMGVGSTPAASRQSRPLALVVPAVPVALAAAALAGAVPQLSVATQRGPDVIRVSIGRVDVRAPAPPPRPTPPVQVPAAKADRLSLQDYLLGQRGTR